MRIGIDCRLWNEGGVGRYIRNLVWNLAELDKKNEYVLFLQSNNSLIHNSQLTNRSNVEIKYTNCKWHSLSEQITFWQELEKEKLDLMHFTYFSHPILYNHPFVITVHDLTILKYKTGRATTKSYPLYLLKRRGYTEVLKHGIYKSVKIIVPTRFVKQDILENFRVPAEKIVVTYEGADIKLKIKKEKL
jgi:glycosyltransferase involved in cell wall biosynthesis